MAPKVFVSGGTGFVASHIIAQLVENGYAVTTSVRTQQKANDILALHPSWKSALDFAIIPDVGAQGAFEAVFRSSNDANEDADGAFDYIIHTASPVDFGAQDLQKDLIDPAVKGTTEVISTAHHLGGGRLKRFVLLGSSVAIQTTQDYTKPPRADFTEEDWNPVTAEAAIANKDVVAAYNASKKLGEQAAWKLMSDEKPRFDLVVINPDIIIGPMIHPAKGPEGVNSTNAFAVYSFLDGTYRSTREAQFPFFHFVDVRDVARAHVLALEKPAASNKRIILVSGLITPQLVVNIVRKNFPELRSRTDEGKPEKILPDAMQTPTGWDTRRSYEVFGPNWTYIPLEKSVSDTVRSILELEGKRES